MKLYVDELPKSCSECVCWDENWGCNIGNFDKKICSLKSLSDYTKQVRKEVCEKIRKWCDKNFNWVGDGTGYDGQDYNECIGFNMAIDQLNEILDTILKEYQK